MDEAAVCWTFFKILLELILVDDPEVDIVDNPPETDIVDDVEALEGRVNSFPGSHFYRVFDFLKCMENEG